MSVDPSDDTVTFGALLRQWRLARHKSQLDLATEANVSTRHISFVETGRTQASRDMVLLFAQVLDVPLRDRNVMLIAAGYAPRYNETPLSAPEMSQVRGALEFILQRQEPYPALVIDRHWNVVLRNSASEHLWSLFVDMKALPRDVARNVMHMVFDPRALRPWIVDWNRVAGGLLQTIHRENMRGIADGETRRLLNDLLSYPGVPTSWRDADSSLGKDAMMPFEMRKDDLAVKLYSFNTTLGTPRDVTLQEIHIECFYPADEATEEFIRRLADPVTFQAASLQTDPSSHRRPEAPR
jgi:transcriptional regulator with XRE-family HTH domain